MTFDWQVQITEISQRTQLLFRSTNTINQLQSQLDNLLAAVETLTTSTLTSFLISHTTLQDILDHISQHFESMETQYILFTNTRYIITPMHILFIDEKITICLSH